MPDGGDGQRRAAGTDALARGREFVNQISGGLPFAEFEKEFFRSVRPTSLLKRFSYRGSREFGGLCVQPAGVRDEWGRTAGGRGRCSGVLLISPLHHTPHETAAAMLGSRNWLDMPWAKLLGQIGQAYGK